MKKPFINLLTLLLSSCLWLAACRQKAPHKQLTFMDSLAADSSLTAQQLKKHTILPANYYYNTSHYESDTVFNIGLEYRAAVLTCDYRGVCEYAYLLVFDRSTLKNTAFKKVKETCDSDGDQGYMELDFAMINDSVFYTKDVYTRKFDDKPDLDSIVAKHYFKIKRDGNIDTLAGYKVSGIKK